MGERRSGHMVHTVTGGVQVKAPKFSALSPEQAAQRVVRALEDRPITISTVVGNISEVLNLVTPLLSDAISHLGASRFPDSAAVARRPAE